MRVARAIASAVSLALLASLPGVASAAPVSSANGILAHRALYKVALAQATSSSEIIDVRGRMGFEWRDDCDGWAIEQRYLMSFSRASGDGYEISSEYTTWESKSGDLYRFIIDRERGIIGIEPEVISG